MENKNETLKKIVRLHECVSSNGIISATFCATALDPQLPLPQLGLCESRDLVS
jgi:hypothetical protein